jgi:hypothetical protein
MLMRVDRETLKLIILQVARAMFGASAFARRPLMEFSELRLRHEGWWDAEDDQISRSAGVKSKGLAAIDFAVTDLAREGKIKSLSHDTWIVAAGEGGSAQEILNIDARKRRLALATGGISGASLPPSAFDREQLYGEDT